jgi:hypothetical protein
MNDDLVFSKTAAGEEAVRERTRLVQRNLRMALILVDGTTNVAALKQKAGDTLMLEPALTELEQMGLIASRDHGTTVSAPMEPVLGDLAPVAPESFAVHSSADDSAAPDTVFDRETANGFAMTGGLGNLDPNYDARKPDTPSGWWQGRRARHLDAQEEALYEHAYGGEEDSHTAVVAPAPIRRMSRFKPAALLAVALLGTVVLGILRVVLYPYEEYRPQFEQRLSKALDDKVTIGNVRVAFVPLPVVILEKVSVGDTPYATADRVRLAPEPSSLLGGHRYRDVRIEGLRVDDGGLTRLTGWLTPAGLNDATVDRLEVERVSLGIGGQYFGNLAGTVELDGQHGISRALLHDKEGDWRIELTPGATGVALAATGGRWKMPFQPGLTLSTIAVSGELAPGRLRLDRIEGQAYEGLYSGSATIAWADSADMTLRLDLDHVAAGTLLEALGGPTLVDGTAAAKLTVSARAERPGGLDAAPRLEGTFKVLRGNLHRIDLVAAIKPAGAASEAVRGGGTSFEELSGTLAADAMAIRLRGVRLASGLLRAGGQATIARGGEGAINGSASVDIGGANLVHGAITISGKAASPELKAGQ